MQRALIILAGIIALAGIGVGVYFYFFAATPAIEITPGSTLPEAGQGPTGGTTTPETPSGASSGPEKVAPRLARISKGPVVPGFAAITIEASSTTPAEVAVSYLERESGNAYSYLVTAGTLTRTSNKTVPGIQEAVWAPDASTAFVRYLSGTDFSTINTYALRSDGSGGLFLAQNLVGVAANASNILTLASGINGSVASLAKHDGTKSATVFSTPLTAIRASFAGKSRYLATTKASGTLPGYAFLVDSAGSFSRIAGPLDGLTASASPSGTWVLVSYVEGSTLKMMLVNTSTRTETALPVATIADKCVWSLDEKAIYCGVPTNPPASFAYPDDWYQGAAHFSDRLWKIDVDGRFASLVLDFKSVAESDLDATALALDPENKALVFTNKNDGSLWVYQL